MLKKQNKLNTKDIKELITAGKRVYGTLFSVVYKPKNTNKFGVTVSKKVYKKAVDRNRAKRRVFGALKDVSPKNIGHYNISVKSKLNTVPFTDISKDLNSVLCQK